MFSHFRQCDWQSILFFWYTHLPVLIISLQVLVEHYRLTRWYFTRFRLLTTYLLLLVSRTYVTTYSTINRWNISDYGSFIVALPRFGNIYSSVSIYWQNFQYWQKGSTNKNTICFTAFIESFLWLVIKLNWVLSFVACRLTIQVAFVCFKRCYFYAVIHIYLQGSYFIGPIVSLLSKCN